MRSDLLDLSINTQPTIGWYCIIDTGRESVLSSSGFALSCSRSTSQIELLVSYITCSWTKPLWIG